MRKTSHDGGDSTSITSGVENEVKKSVMKPKKSSLKRRAPNFSHESDETVIEPLLQNDKEKTESTPSAKYFSKGKTDTTNNKECENKVKTTSTTGFCGTTESLLSFKDSDLTKTTSGVVAPIHNYMNTNVFNTHSDSKVNVTTKSQILVEIDGSKPSGYNPSPLIFTTAKIHTDGKSKNMEPVQVTPVPILSTVEVSITKAGSVTTNEKKVSNGSSIINADYSLTSFSKAKEEKVTVNNVSAVSTSTTNKETFGITAASTSKLSNTTSVQSSFRGINLPSTTTKLVSTVSSKDKQSKDVEQSLAKNKQPQLKSLNLDNIKNNVTVTTPSSGKVNVIDMSIKSVRTGVDDGIKQTDKSQINKLDANLDNKISSSESSSHLQSITSTTSKISIGIQPTDPAKTISITPGIKQLQRQQKTLTDETSNVESKTNANVKDSQDSSAKKIFPLKDASHPKVIDSTIVKDCDKLPIISANNTENINAKPALNTAANITNNVTSVSTPKSTVTSVGISNTMTTPTNVTSKSLPNIEKKISPTITTTNALSNISKPSTVTIPTTNATAIAKTTVSNVTRATAIPSDSLIKSSELTSVQLVGSVDKTIFAKKAAVTNSADIKTTQKSSLNSNAVITPKPSAALTSASMPITTTIPAVSTTVKETQPSSIVSQSIANTKTPTKSVSLSTVFKDPVVTTSTKMTPVSTIAPTSTASQKHTSVSVTANKQPIATTSTSAVTKKTSSVNSNTTASSSATVKSPNNNSSQTSAFSKPSTTLGSNINPSVTLPKTAAVNLTASVPATSAIKSAQNTSPATTTTKDASISTKKSMIAKTPSVTTSQSSVRKSVAAVSTKALSSVVSLAPTTKQSATSIGKSVLSKSPSVTTSTKTPSVTSVSSTNASTTATKPSTTSSTQVSSNKPVAVAGTSPSSSTSVPRPLDATIKKDSKSSECKKDDKLPKA